MRVSLASLFVAFAIGCSSAQHATAVTPPTHDVAGDRAALMQADRDFARAAATRGLEGWVDAFEDDGAQIIDKKGAIRGHEAIRALMTKLFTNPDAKLEWEPERAEASGDLGWTYGHARLMHKEADGSWTIARKLQYVTIWHRQPDGKWKVQLDIGNEDVP